MRAKLWTMRFVFGMAGIGISLWAVIIPYTKIRFSLDDQTLGMILFASGIGGVAVMPLAGFAVARFGSRAVTVAAGLGMGLMLPLMPMAPTPLAFTGLLLVYGAIFGTMDTAMNAQGAVVERLSGALQMSGFHASYSIGTLGVALADSFLLRLGASYPVCALAGTGVVLAILSQSWRLAGKALDAPADGPLIALPNRATIVLGLCCFVCFLTEGAATDWSAIFLRFSRGMPIDSATLGYAAFAVSMSASRLSGDRVAGRLGQPVVLRAGCVTAVLGFAIVVFVRDAWIDVLGFGLVGLGTGNIAPLVFSAAARVKGQAPHLAVPAVMAFGYAGFLLGPVFIGFVANRFGLGSSFGVDAALLAMTFFAAKAVA